MKTKRAKIVLGVCVCLAASVSIGLWQLWPHERLLLKQSRRIPNFALEQREYGYDYEWLTSRELLLYLDPNNTFQEQVWKLNMETGTRTRQPILEKRLNERQEKYNGHYPSPDGKWVLYSDYYESKVSAVPLDDARHVVWHSVNWGPTTFQRSQHRLGNMNWLPSSREWIETEWDINRDEPINVLIRSVDHPRSLTRVPIPPSVRVLYSGSATTAACEILPVSRTLIVAYDYPAEISWDDDMKRKTRFIPFYAADLRSSRPPRRWNIPLPAGTELESMAVSPQVHYVAWIVHTRYAAPLLTFLRRLHLPVSAAKRPITALYVSRVDGTEMREIGHLYVTPDSESEEDVETVSWSPDETRLLFQYKSALWTVPAH